MEEHNNNIILQFEEDPATKHVTPNESNISRKPGAFTVVLQKAVAEMIGTFFIVFVGCAGRIVCVGGTPRGDMSGAAGSALSGGMAVVIMIFCTASISCAHLNPSVTLGFAIAGLFPWAQVIPYILSQIIGGLLASLMLQVLVHDATLLSLAVNQPLHHDSETFVMECLATFLLMVVNLKVACNLRKIGELGGIFMIGMTVTLLGFCAGPIGGSLSMNPARSIGPAIVMMRFKSLHIYILGPTLGATMSGLIYGTICQNNLDGKSSSTKHKYFSQLFTFSSGH